MGEKPFGQALIGSFAGAGGGAWAATVIAERKEQKEILAEFNFIKSILRARKKSLLNLKKNFTSPLKEEIIGFEGLKFQRAQVGKNQISVPSFNVMRQEIFVSHLSLVIDLNKVGKFCDRGTNIITLLIYLQEHLDNLMGAIAAKNVLVSHIRSSNKDIFEFMGVNSTDVRLLNIANEFVYTLDICLCLLKRTEVALDVLAKGILKNTLYIKYDLSNDETREDKKLIPDDGLLNGLI